MLKKILLCMLFINVHVNMHSAQIYKQPHQFIAVLQKNIRSVKSTLYHYRGTLLTLIAAGLSYQTWTSRQAFNGLYEQLPSCSLCPNNDVHCHQGSMLVGDKGQGGVSILCKHGGRPRMYPTLTLPHGT